MKARKPTGEKLRKGELMEKIAAGLPVNKAQAQQVVKKLEEVIVEELKAGRNVSLGIGQFKRKDKPAKKAQKGGKKAINRFTGEEYVTSDRPAKPAQAAVKFYPNAALKRELN